MNVDDKFGDHQARITQEREQREQQRALDRQQQRSPLMSAQERIQLWEKLHQLSLPRADDHALVQVVARATGLEPADIQEEQRRRASARAAHAL